MSESKLVVPQYPFLVMNEHYISRPESIGLHNKITAKGFKNGRFKENTFVIDINCMKFPVIDVLNLGRSLWPFDLLSRHKLIKVKPIYGAPVQLTYEEARHEIVELICRRGWYTEGRVNEKQFRENRAQCNNMAELINGKPKTKDTKGIGGISFYGKWVL
jgi:hypothetical protein